MLKKHYNDIFTRISEEKRNKILKIATREFANKGLSNANINVIAEKSSVSVGSLYKYFNSKEDLFLTTISFGVDFLKSTLNNLLSSDEHILLKAEKIIRLIQSHSRENQDLIKLYNEITSDSMPQLVQSLSKELESISSHTYTLLLEQAQKDGLLRKDFDPNLFAFFIDNLFMMLQFSYSCEYYQQRFKIYAGDDIFEKDDYVVKQMLNFLEATLK